MEACLLILESSVWGRDVQTLKLQLNFLGGGGGLLKLQVSNFIPQGSTQAVSVNG